MAPLTTKHPTTPTADELLAQLEATLLAFRNHPEFAAARRQLDAAQRAASAAGARQQTCRQQLAGAAAPITCPDLLELERLLVQRIAEIPTRRAELAKEKHSDEQRKVHEARLRAAQAEHEHALADVRVQLVAVRLPSKAELLSARADVRQAYRAAEAAAAAAIAAVEEMQEPLADAKYAVKVARTNAIADVRKRALQLHGDSVRLFAAALEAAARANALTRRIAAGINAALGPNLLDDVGWYEFDAPGDAMQSRFEIWQSYVRSHAPHSVER